MTWPEAGLWRPRDPGPGPEFWLLTGAEPARTWQAFASEFIDVALRDDITGFVTLGAMLSDVPHTRPISIFASSQNEQVREAHALERSVYEGPVGILTVLEHFAENAGILREPLGERPALRRLGRPVAEGHPRAPRPARGADRCGCGPPAPPHGSRGLGGVDRCRRVRGRGHGGVHPAAGAHARHVGLPDASGDAIAQAFERYLRRRDDGRGDRKR